MRFPSVPAGCRRSALVALQVTGLVGLAAAAWLAGCSANDPFDPATLENTRPVVRMSMSPVDPDQQLNPTSYFARTFFWSASDPDGWVTEYYVSVRTEAGVPAPWDTTARTDTTMTFVTDAEGHAEATFLLACRDNRGAVSDTLVQYIPLKNFPPAVNFQTDYDPQVNLQREFRDLNGDVTENPTAAVDTVYWNWGPMNFRMFALDLDGQEAMDSFYRYTLVDPALGDPEITFAPGDPDADPTVGWVQVEFPLTNNEVKQFEIFISDAPTGENTTLTVAVNDEADADTRFQYSWEVREPGGPVLFVPDNLAPNTKTFYRNILASEYGEGGWSEYTFWFGYPDHSFVLVESMRKFQAVLWADGGGPTSPRLLDAAQTGGALSQYLYPLSGQEPGHLLMVSKGVIGTTSALPHPFIKGVLGIDPSPSPVAAITTVAGKAALGLQPDLPAMTSITSSGRAMGLKIHTDPTQPVAEPIYQMEYCLRCYGDRLPYDPVVGMRCPRRDVATLASAVIISLQLEYFSPAEVQAGLSAILREELGVTGE